MSVLSRRQTTSIDDVSSFQIFSRIPVLRLLARQVDFMRRKLGASMYRFCTHAKGRIGSFTQHANLLSWNYRKHRTRLRSLAQFGDSLYPCLPSEHCIKGHAWVPWGQKLLDSFVHGSISPLEGQRKKEAWSKEQTSSAWSRKFITYTDVKESWLRLLAWLSQQWCNWIWRFNNETATTFSPRFYSPIIANVTCSKTSNANHCKLCNYYRRNTLTFTHFLKLENIQAICWWLNL